MVKSITSIVRSSAVAVVLLLLALATTPVRSSSSTYRIDWGETPSGTTSASATVEVVTNPLLDPEEESHSEITSKIWTLLEELDADFVRYLAWFPYPHYSVAKDVSGWHTGKMSSMFERFVTATEGRGHDTVLNFAAQPGIFFDLESAHNLSEEAYEPVWTYANGNLLEGKIDSLAEYYNMIWKFAKNGWAVDSETGENVSFCGSGGNCAKSNLKYWELFNENEHYLSPDEYVTIFNKIRADMVKNLGEENIPKLVVGSGMPHGMLMNVLKKIDGMVDYVSFNYRTSSRERTNPYTYEE